MICNMRGVISTSFHFGRACLINAYLYCQPAWPYLQFCVSHMICRITACARLFFFFYPIFFKFSNFQGGNGKNPWGLAYMHVHVFYVNEQAIEIFATCMYVRIHGAACFMQCPPTPRQSTAQPNAAQRIDPVLLLLCRCIPLISLPPASFFPSLPFPTFSSNTSCCLAHYLPLFLLERKYIVRWLGTMVNAPFSILYLFFAKSPFSLFPLPFPLPHSSKIFFRNHVDFPFLSFIVPYVQCLYQSIHPFVRSFVHSS